MPAFDLWTLDVVPGQTIRIIDRLEHVMVAVDPQRSAVGLVMAAQGIFHLSSLTIQDSGNFDVPDWHNIDEGIAIEPSLRAKVIDEEGLVWDVHHIDHGRNQYWVYGGKYDIRTMIRYNRHLQGGRMVAQSEVKPFIPKLVVLPSTFQVTYMAHDAASHQKQWRDFLDAQEGQQKSKIEHLMGVAKGLIEARQRYWLAPEKPCQVMDIS